MSKMRNVHDKHDNSIDRVQSPLVKFCVTATSCIMIACVSICILLFKTDTIMDIDTSLDNVKSGSYNRTSVETVMNQLNKEEPEPAGESTLTPPVNPNVPGVSEVSSDVLVFTEGGNFQCDYGYCYTYMGWQLVVSESSRQYVWRQQLFPDWVNGSNAEGSASAFDTEGFGRVNGRYVVATTHKDDGGIGEVGQSIDVYLENGNVIKCIIGDVKSRGDATWTKWGHRYNNNVSVIEFIVNAHGSHTVKWYEPFHVNPGNASCHPEWKSPIVKIVRY